MRLCSVPVICSLFYEGDSWVVQIVLYCCCRVMPPAPIPQTPNIPWYTDNFLYKWVQVHVDYVYCMLYHTHNYLCAHVRSKALANGGTIIGHSYN